MHSSKTPRILLSLLLILGVFSSFTLSSVHADTTSSVTLSPAIVSKLDAFVAKVQALRSRYSSDENWGMFIDNLSKKIIALKSRYVENPLILAVLDRLNSGVMGLKISENTIISSVSSTVCPTPQFETTIKPVVWGTQAIEHLKPNSATAIQFTTGTGGMIKFYSVEAVVAYFAERYGVISKCPGVFEVEEKDRNCLGDGSELNTQTEAYVGDIPADLATKPMTVGGGTVGDYIKRVYCMLEPNTTYYYNITHANRYANGSVIYPHKTAVGGAKTWSEYIQSSLANTCVFPPNASSSTCAFHQGMEYYKSIGGSNTPDTTRTTEQKNKEIAIYNALSKYIPARDGLSGIRLIPQTDFGP